MTLVKSVRLNIITDPGTSKEKLDAIDAKARELGKLNPSIKVSIDDAAAKLKLAVLKTELKNTGTQSDQLGGKFRNLGRSLDQALPKFANLGAAAVALGPAALPVLAAVTAATLGLGTALAGAGAALGIFAIAAKSHLADMEKQLKKVQAANLAANKALAVPPGQRTATQKQQIADAKAMTAAFQKEYGALATAQEQLHKAWKKFTSTPIVNSALANGMKLLTDILPHLTPLLRLGGLAFNVITSSIQGFIASGGLDRLVHGLVAVGRPAIIGFVNILHNLAVAFGALSGGAAKFSGGVIAALVRLSQVFATWAVNKGPGMLTGLMNTIKRLGPGVGQLLLNLARILPNLARGLFPLAPLSLALSNALARLIAKVPPKVITALAIAFLAVYGAIKLITAATKVWEGVQAVMNVLLDANPIGLIVIGLAALTTGIIIAYTHSETFRKIVQAVFHDVLVVIMGVWNWIKKNWPLLLAILTGPIGALVVFVVRHFNAIRSAIGGAIKIIEIAFLTMIDRMLGGLRNLTGTLGHLPGPLGAPFRAMSGAIDSTRAHIRSLIGDIRGVHGKSVQLHVKGTGAWVVTGPGGPQIHRGVASGWKVSGGIPGVDSVPIMAMPGELVIPTPIVRSGAVDHLRGRIPGFARGGIVGNFSDGAAGLGRWVAREDSATITAFERAVARATFAAMRAAGAGGGGFGVPGPGGGAPAANAALARRMFPSVNWPAWNYVEMREAGWNQFARNPKSGAYGIPQALPPSKMGPAANPPQSNPAAQISWMVGYMNSRYGGSIGAAAHERAFNWYDKGGYLPRGLSLAYNGTGRPERVLGPGEGAAVVIQLAGSGHGTLDRALLQWIQNSVRVQGGGDVQVAFGAS